MAKLNETPSANRLHIGIFGKTNSGKSSFINIFTGQEVSIVANVAGTTTDPVYKAMEIQPLGPCVLIDTAGYDDHTQLGALREKKTRLAAERTDIAVIVISAEDSILIDDENSILNDDENNNVLVMSSDENHLEIQNSNLSDKKYDSDIFDRKSDSDTKFMNAFPMEYSWYQLFKEKKTPVLFVVNKVDLNENADDFISYIKNETKETAIPISCITKQGFTKVKETLIRMMPESFGTYYITGDLVDENDQVLLVVPQDIQAPKGRLILPQVQTIRELLDKKCLISCVTTDKLVPMLNALKQPPKLIITDSQVFDYVYDNKPEESLLTSFSVLFAAYKGDIRYYVQSTHAISKLNEKSKILIAECCTHAPLQEDIGRVKIPKMLKEKYGAGLQVDMVAGTDFPQDLTGYDLIIQCGGCMFNRKYVLSRIERARQQGVPMTNYGITIAYIKGILDKISVIG